ncbi:hypothetical protein ACHAXH_004918 [Discostella pseudostelligera]
MLPPLPSSLSTRLLSTINPETGACKHHPAVQLCELADNETRWIVRRKICSKCGARAPVGVSRRMPGVSVVNPSSNKDHSRSRASNQSPQPRPSSSLSRGRSRSASSTDRHRERSASSSRSKSVQDLTTSKSDGGSERRRTTSTSRSLRERKTTGNDTADHDHHHRRSRSASSTSKQRMLIEAALSSAKAEADTARGLYGGETHRHPSSNDASAVAPSAIVGTPTFHSRALEFTSKVLTTTAPETTNSPGNNDLTSPLTAEQGIREVDKFDESDPFIIIPVINPDDNRMPPPPPPRSPEEMERHMQRLKLRQASLRKEYQERRAKMAAVARTSSSRRDKVVAAVPADPPAAADSTNSRSNSTTRERKLSKQDANRDVNYQRRSVSGSSEPARTKVSPPRSRQATTRGRDRHSKDEFKSKPASTSLVLSATTRSRSANHRDSSREKTISTAGKELAKHRTRSIEKTPRRSNATEHGHRRSSTHEKNRSSRSMSIEHSSRSLSRTRQVVLHSGDEGHRSEEHSHSNRSRSYSMKSSKGGRSTFTNSTKPESVSSNSHQSKSTIKIVLSRSASNDLEPKEDSQPVVFQRMERAHRKGGKRHYNRHDDYDSISYYSQPMAHIQCSSDEQSHASSISESLFTNEFDVKDRSLLLSITKGGAKQLVTRSKSALGGVRSLNNARRKFQSALLV